MKKKVLMIAAMMTILGGAAMAQTSFTLKLGGGFPMGDFADAKVSSSNGVERWGLLTKDEEGGAGVGFNLGAEWCIPVSSINGLGIVVSIDAFYNGLNEDLNDFFEDMRDDMDDDYDEYSLITPSYLNFPVMVGAKYQLDVTPGIGLYGAAALGANLRIVTPFKLEYEYSESSGSYSYSTERSTTLSAKAAVSFGFRLAAGVTFADKYSVELGYYNLGAGKVKIEGEYEYDTNSNGTRTSGSDTEKETLKSITPELFTLRLGIKF